VTVNHLVAGSSPAAGATFKPRFDQKRRGFFVFMNELPRLFYLFNYGFILGRLIKVISKFWRIGAALA
jgi:hypothetical protein